MRPRIVRLLAIALIITSSFLYASLKTFSSQSQNPPKAFPPADSELAKSPQAPAGPGKEQKVMSENNRSIPVELFVLDRLFSQNSRLFDNDRTSLGDLIILRLLFGPEDGSSKREKGLNLANLIVLDRLFGTKSSFFGNKNLNLGELIVLDRLFGQILTDDSERPDLGNLFILYELFHESELLDSKPIRLGDLLVLERLFSD